MSRGYFTSEIVRLLALVGETLSTIQQNRHCKAGDGIAVEPHSNIRRRCVALDAYILNRYKLAVAHTWTWGYFFYRFPGELGFEILGPEGPGATLCWPRFIDFT